MKLRRYRWALPPAAVLLAVALALWYVESREPPFSWANYQRIDMWMTLEQVEEILGPPRDGPLVNQHVLRTDAIDHPPKHTG